MATAQEWWQRYCQTRIADRALGFALDVSRVRFQDRDLTPLWPKMTQALTAMQQLEAGSIANPDENRMVGHYWLRSPDLAPTPAITQEIRVTQASVRDFAADVHQQKIVGKTGPIAHVLHVGIGGSALGPQFVAQALGTANDPLTMHFVDNTDPDGIDLVLAQLQGQLGRTLTVVVSKSGGTPETRNGMLEIQAAYRAAGIEFAPHAVAVTQDGSALHKTAVQEGWLKTFPMWDWVGGRTSVLSAVGLVPAALQGLNVQDLLDGAAAMDLLTRREDARQNPAAMLALMWYHIGGGKGLKDMVILPYKDRLALFSKYLQQLVMESLGKEFDRKQQVVEQGIAVYGNNGSTDQHAYVQQLRDGIPNFFATFIQVLHDRAGSSIDVGPGITTGDYLQGLFLGTRAALAEKNRDSITITVDEVNGKTVGALIALYERAVGLYAEMVDINAYHQPGVEAGKKAAASVLKLQTAVVTALKTAATEQTAGQLAGAIGEPDQVEHVYKILEHLAANPDRGVTRTAGDGPLTDQFRAD
ncbi:MAG TPA: glucose-6-phosphate isomerase [Planctomycetaceae bacterium]|nr:glucose-6-phosphate isomerase [Planctomycetaceae bacterium]